MTPLKHGGILPIARHLVPEKGSTPPKIDGLHGDCDMFAGTPDPHLRRGTVILGRGCISLDTIPQDFVFGFAASAPRRLRSMDKH